jgi:hypothetical protein
MQIFCEAETPVPQWRVEWLREVVQRDTQGNIVGDRIQNQIAVTDGEVTVNVPLTVGATAAELLQQSFTDPATGKTRSWDVPRPIGSMALREGGGAIIALPDGVHTFDFETGENWRRNFRGKRHFRRQRTTRQQDGRPHFCHIKREILAHDGLLNRNEAHGC